MATKTYTPTQRFYQDLVCLLGSLYSYMFAAETIRNGTPPEVIGCPDFPMNVNSAVFEREYVLYPRELLLALSQDTVPASIELHEGKVVLRQPRVRLTSPSHKHLASQIIEGAYLRYYENYVGRVRSKYGNDSKEWPAVWNFGRVVRNAFGHGGAIDIHNPQSPPVTWYSITYSHSDNGRQVLFNDISICDVIFLMEEMDAEI